MSVESRDAVLLGEIQALFGLGVVQGSTDGQLLERFLTADDITAEAAFTSLVERHGPMVLHVCRGILDEPQDAQDAFQATFLVFLRRAGSIRKRESVASWLFGVALRVARRARYAAIVRRFHERRGGALAATRRSTEIVTSDCRAALHEEIARLPGRYREPIVLCHLEGLPTAVAAQRLGCAHGTILSRLARGRDRLRRRLAGRGLVVPVWLLAANLVPREATAALLRTVAGRAALTTAVSPVVAALARATLRTLFMTRFALVAAVLVAAVLVTVTIPLVRPIFGGGAPAAFPGRELQSAEEKPHPDVRERVLSPELEETFYKMLRRDREFNDPRWPYLIKVRDVQDKTLIDATLKHRVGGKDNEFDLVIQAKHAVFRFDLEAKVVRVFLDESEVQHFGHSTDVVLFNDRVLVFPIPPGIRFMTEQALSPPRPKIAPGFGKAEVVNWVRSLAYSPDGKTLVTAGFEGAIDLWDTVESKKVGSFQGDPSIVHFVAFAPDGKTLASVGNEGTVKLWDVPAGTLNRALPGSSESLRQVVRNPTIGRVAFSPDGLHLAVSAWGDEGSGTGTAKYVHEVRVLDRKDGRAMWSHMGRGEWPFSLAFAPDGKVLASKGFGAVNLWDAQTGEPLRTLKPARGGIYDIVFSPDRRMLAGGGRFRGGDGRDAAEFVALWNVTTGEILHTLEGHTGTKAGVGVTVVFSPDGKTIALGGAGRVGKFGRQFAYMQKVLSDIRLWEVATGKLLWAFEGELGEVNSLSFSPDGKTLAYCDSQSVGIIDVRTGQLERTLKTTSVRQRP